ncbi:NADP-dependent oxidoreductase domain-containing protein [Gorgonomyces haynaldii]|nr:NADP-dependent oxidoreductase domain-containing protein [Gorgonomyces haynaldii]
MIPKLAMGTYRLRDQECYRLVKEAIKMGYRHIDTAIVYKNETEIGNAIRESIQEGIVERSDLFITSKIAPKQQGREKASKAIRESLERLQLEYLDLMLIHWPGTQNLRGDNPKNVENRRGTLEALLEAQQQGLVKNIGVSNYLQKHLDPFTLANIQVNQFEFHPLQATPEIKQLFALLRQHNIQIEAYSSFGEGKLFDVLKELDFIAHETGFTKAQILLCYGMQKGCIVLPKASSVDRLRENLKAQGLLLDQKYMDILDSIPQDRMIKYCWDPETIQCIDLNPRNQSWM